MTTACPCFGRNEKCALCSGSGILSPAIENKARLINSSGFYSAGQSEHQKKLDALESKARQMSARAPLRKEATKVEMDEAFEKRRQAEIAERVAWAESRRIEAEEFRDSQERSVQSAREDAERKKSLQEKNDQIRAMRAEKEKSLVSILAAKKDAIAQGKNVTGPYRCLRCQWINESNRRQCFLCKTSDRYVEIF